jgi:hypothetical protein
VYEVAAARGAKPTWDGSGRLKGLRRMIGGLANRVEVLLNKKYR